MIETYSASILLKQKPMTKVLYCVLYILCRAKHCSIALKVIKARNAEFITITRYFLKTTSEWVWPCKFDTASNVCA